MFRSDLNLTIATPRPSPNTICELPLHNPSPIWISTICAATTTVATRSAQPPPPFGISPSTAATRSAQPPPPFGISPSTAATRSAQPPPSGISASTGDTTVRHFRLHCAGAGSYVAIISDYVLVVQQQCSIHTLISNHGISSYEWNLRGTSNTRLNLASLVSGNRYRASLLVLNAVIELINFKVDEKVRVAAISAANAVENELPIPEFLDSPIIGLAEMKIPALGEALEAPTIKVQVQALVALNETMQRLLQSRQFYMAVSGSKRKAKSFKDDEYFILCESVSMGRKLTSIQSTIIGNKVQMMKPHLRHEVRTVQHHQCGEASPPFKFQIGVNSRSFSSFAFARRTVTNPDNRISETGIPKLYEFSSSYD
nr:importin-5-like [Ipomoea batatas]